MIKIRVSRKLKSLRVSNNLNQTELANLVGCSRNAISEIETGLYQPTLKLAYNLACALGCKLDDLLEVVSDERN